MVQETDERLCFLVRSDANSTVQYRVDCLANKGAGQCACPNFRIKKQKAIDAGLPPWTQETACKHLRRAAWHVIRLTFPRLAKGEQNKAHYRKMTCDSYLHKPVSFDGPKGQRLVGIVIACEEAPPFGTGKIPDYRLQVRGNSGKTLTISVCSNHAQLCEN
jgi:hypothetical protein